jgi:hypothetical protein
MPLVSKPLRYPENEELPEKFQDQRGREIIYPVSNISGQLTETTFAYGMTESIQLRDLPALSGSAGSAVQPVLKGI